jgi:hypothetical protein
MDGRKHRAECGMQNAECRRTPMPKARRSVAQTYLGGADAAVLFLLKGRGSGLGSLDKLELALAARHTRGLRHLDDSLPMSIGGGRSRGVSEARGCW